MPVVKAGFGAFVLASGMDGVQPVTSSVIAKPPCLDVKYTHSHQPPY